MAAALGAALALLCGCAAETDDWATPAAAWIQGYDQAFEDEGIEHALYYSHEARLDLSMLMSRNDIAAGRAAAMQMSRLEYGPVLEHGGLFLGPEGVVRTVALYWEYYDEARAALRHYRIGDDGIESIVSMAPTWIGYTIAHGQGDALAAAERIAADYLDAWNSGDPEAIRAVYAREATLTDGIAGTSAQGREQIAALSDARHAVQPVTAGEALPPFVLQADAGPPDDTPAVFFFLDLTRPREPAEVWLIVRSEESCPGESVVALTLDRELDVVSEQRFRSLASLRECGGPDQVPTGWWTGRSLPVSFSERVTGTVATPDGEVEMRNGSAAADALVRWAFGRFSLAGLAPPVVSSIAFDPFHPRCDSMPGYADWSEGTTAILVCLDSAGIGAPSGSGAEVGDFVDLPRQGHLVLHELGHAWLLDNLDAEQQRQLMQQVAAESWNSSDDRWRERGVEWAAESLAWGLRGQAGSSVPLGSPACAALAEGFRIVTGTEPLTPCDEP